MKNLLWKIVLVALLSALSFGDDLQDAKVAYDKKDYELAFRLFNSACENGDSAGCGAVGVFHRKGLWVKQDLYKGLSYYSKSCDMGNQLGCKEHIKLQAVMPVCTEDELSLLKDRRYFEVASSDTYPIIVADTQTIRIDKRNKIIQVWTTWVLNQKSRDEWIQDYGQNYNNFGYYKSLVLINYGNMTFRFNTITYYNCDGGVIQTTGASEWDNIVPDSVMEGITQTIMKKYHLK